MAGARVSGSIFQRASAASESDQDSQVQPPCLPGRGSPSLLTLKTQNHLWTRKSEVQSPELDDRRVRRREKNRVAAQRSRKKQTQKADKLHEEYESLEQENSSLKKEVGKLAEELKRLSEVLKAHEQICPLLHRPMNLVTMPRAADGIAGCLPR